MKYLEKLLLLSLRTGVDAQVHVAVPVDVAVDVEDHEHATVRVKIPEAVNKVRIFKSLRWRHSSVGRVSFKGPSLVQLL